MRFSRIIIAVAAVIALVPGGAIAKQAADASRNSSNLELVTGASIPFPKGTDLEFFSRTLTAYRLADGTTVDAPEGVERHFALVGNEDTGTTGGARIIDITSPETPYVVARITDCRVAQGDPQVTKDGMLAAIAKQGSGTCKKTAPATGTLANGSAMVDLSDVYAPKVIGFAPETSGSHNNTLHPSGKYLYISTSDLTPNDGGANARIPIYDISNPATPVKVMDFKVPGNGPHDIRFSADGKRAYFAGISAFTIVNTEDPKNPVVISRIVPPGGSIGHDTLVTRDGRFLFLGDEGGGGSTYPCPGGAIYAYDLTDERAPILLGASWAGGGPVTGRLYDEVPGPTSVGGCTSHVMELNPDGHSLTIGWYTLGTRTFDFSSFYNADGTPKTAAGVAAAWGKNGVGLVETGYMIPQGANTWSAKQYSKVPGYIFSDDLNLGFYVTKIKS
jgi:hypothetical protein